jgi:hypothetical protein
MSLENNLEKNTVEADRTQKWQLNMAHALGMLGN